MNKTLMVAIGVAALAIPVIAAAADTMMATMSPPANAANTMCRTAASGEKPNATLGTQPLVCKSMSAMMEGPNMKVPDTSKLDRDGADRAWRQWLGQSLIIPPGGTGGGG